MNVFRRPRTALTGTFGDKQENNDHHTDEEELGIDDLSGQHDYRVAMTPE